MRGPIPQATRILSITLAIALGLGNPCWSQDNPNPPAPTPQEPPEQAPPAPPPTPPPAENQLPASPETAPSPAVEAPQPPAKKGATLKGRVLGVDRKTPQPTSVVHAVAPDGKVISSQAADAKGNYLLSGLPPGTYTLAVEVNGGVFRLESPVGVSSAQTFTVDLATVPAGAATAAIPGVAGTPRGYCYIVQGKKPAGTSFWKTPKGIVLLAATAVAVGLIFAESGNDNNDEGSPVSPSAP